MGDGVVLFVVVVVEERMGLVSVSVPVLFRGGIRGGSCGRSWVILVWSIVGRVAAAWVSWAGRERRTVAAVEICIINSVIASEARIMWMNGLIGPLLLAI